MRRHNPESAFTLIELLTVIAIIAILAAIVGPSISHWRKGDAMAAGTRQLQDAVARARQLAISQRTTVYLVFVEEGFWNRFTVPLNLAQRTAATNLADKQLTGYNFLSLRTVGDQPGQGIAHYLSSWQTLPEGIYISPEKFRSSAGLPYRMLDPDATIPGSFLFGVNDVAGFTTNALLPFPTEDSPRVIVPHVAFDYTGRVVSGPLGRDELIPLAHGGVLYGTDPITKGRALSLPMIQETPPGNTTNSYNVVRIDSLTGRGHLEKREMR